MTTSNVSNRPNPFRNEGTHFKALSGDGMRPAAFCALPVEKAWAFRVSRFMVEFGCVDER